jgi:hypothetical protein
LFACCVFSVHVSAPYSKILWGKAWYISFLVTFYLLILDLVRLGVTLTTSIFHRASQIFVFFRHFIQIRISDGNT